MRVAGRTQLIAISLGAHAILGVALGAVHPKRHREVIAITVSDTKKRVPPRPASAPEPDPPVPARPLRAKSAPAQAKAAPIAPATNAQPSMSLDALPDFGLSLSGGGAGGMAVPAANRAAFAPAAANAKVLSRSASARGDDCADPPAKPTSMSHPTPAYPPAAVASGIAGKVRVEIAVDEHGRVVSARILQGLGPGFDEAALAAARASTFEPALRCGRPSVSTFKIAYSFRPPTP
jgi:periplasmic protein TonB